MIIHIPWPPASLHPNKRVHWATKAKAAKGYRTDCYYATKAGGGQPTHLGGTITLDIIFHPASARKYDLDNALAAIKSGLDGVADAIGIDDSRWALRIEKGDPVRGGMIVIKIEVEEVTHD